MVGVFFGNYRFGNRGFSSKKAGSLSLFSIIGVALLTWDGASAMAPAPDYNSDWSGYSGDNTLQVVAVHKGFEAIADPLSAKFYIDREGAPEGQLCLYIRSVSGRLSGRLIRGEEREFLEKDGEITINEWEGLVESIKSPLSDGYALLALIDSDGRCDAKPDITEHYLLPVSLSQKTDDMPINLLIKGTFSPDKYRLVDSGGYRPNCVALLNYSDFSQVSGFDGVCEIDAEMANEVSESISFEQKIDGQYIGIEQGKITIKLRAN